jgi:hypothetical protein
MEFVLFMLIKSVGSHRVHIHSDQVIRSNYIVIPEGIATALDFSSLYLSISLRLSLMCREYLTNDSMACRSALAGLLSPVRGMGVDREPAWCIAIL